MPCSAVTLSLATITGIIATALLAIAFSTDNWLYTEVKRAQIQVRKFDKSISQEDPRKKIRCETWKLEDTIGRRI